MFETLVNIRQRRPLFSPEINTAAAASLRHCSRGGLQGLRMQQSALLLLTHLQRLRVCDGVLPHPQQEDVSNPLQTVVRRAVEALPSADHQNGRACRWQLHVRQQSE